MTREHRISMKEVRLMAAIVNAEIVPSKEYRVLVILPDGDIAGFHTYSHAIIVLRDYAQKKVS